MWGIQGRQQVAVFIPRAELCLDPINVAAGQVVTIDATGVSNNGVLINGSPKLQDYQVIEWTVANDGMAQAYLNADSAHLSAPVTQRVDAIDRSLTGYSIKNTGTAPITLHIWGM